MCGLAGFVRTQGKHRTPATVYSMFLNTFITAQLRGTDSSGVAGLWRSEPKNKKRKLLYGWLIAKDLRDPVTMWQSLWWYIFKKAEGRKDTHDQPYIQAALAHCRAATVGNIKAENAHPFSFDNNKFIGIHNGTIDDPDRVFSILKRTGVPLEDTKETDKAYDDPKAGFSDSEIILYCIYRYGIDAVYPLLRGAWALVWYREYEGTISIVRNFQRTLHYYFDPGTDAIYFASEGRMLSFAANRELKTYEAAKLKSFDPHSLYTIDLITSRYLYQNLVDFPFEEVRELIPFQPKKEPAKIGYGGSVSSTDTPAFLDKPAGKVSVIYKGGKETVSFVPDKQKATKVIKPTASSKCCWCNEPIPDDDDTIRIPGYGHVCSKCHTDINELRQIIEMFPVLCQEPDVVQRWLTMEDELAKEAMRG